MAWIKFVRDYDKFKLGDVVWSEEKSWWKPLVKKQKKRIAGRCVNPDGTTFEESTPEEVDRISKNEKEDYYG